MLTCDGIMQRSPFLSSAGTPPPLFYLFARNGPVLPHSPRLSWPQVLSWALRLLSGDAFVTPKQRNEAAAALAAAMVAASSAPAMAEVPQFSIFGFGSGQSDAYSQNDNPINPYSQFSEPGEDSVYKARSEAEVARRTKALQAALKRFENTPEYINTKQAQGLKANLLEAGGSLKEDMYYFSGAEGSKTYEKARQFAQKVGTLGVDGQNKQWARAAEDFTVASKILAEWKQMSNFQ